MMKACIFYVFLACVTLHQMVECTFVVDGSVDQSSNYKNTELRELKSLFLAQNQQIQQLLERMDEKDREISELKSVVAKCEGHSVTKNSVKRDNEDNVYFFAEMQHFTRNTSSHQTLVFELVKANENNAYNPNTGIFTAPVAGVFVFSTTLMADPTHYNRYQIMLNGVVYSNMLAHGSATTYDTTSQTVIIEMKPGDKVYVEHFDPNGFAHGHMYSSFTGFLQQQNYSDPIGVIG